MYKVSGQEWNHEELHYQLDILEKTRNFIRFKFVKKTSITNPIKSLGYIKCHSSSIPRPVDKSPSNAIRYNCQKTGS